MEHLRENSLKNVRKCKGDKPTEGSKSFKIRAITTSIYPCKRKSPDRGLMMHNAAVNKIVIQRWSRREETWFEIYTTELMMNRKWI
jgi:hypothetical protein